MLPQLLIGVGAAVLLWAANEEKSAVSTEPTPSKKSPKPKKSTESVETASQAFARAEKESEAKWSDKFKAQRAKHKTEVSTLKGLLTVEKPETITTTPPKDEE